MIQPLLRQPAYVLHTRAFRETSSIVELLTLEHGRVGGVARGARGGGRIQPIEPFARFEVSWRGRGQLVTITAREAVHHWHLAERFLFAGLYLNELLVRTLKHEEPVTDLFNAYEQALGRLEVGRYMEATLRVFEKRLLRELGYELSFDVDVATGEAVSEDRNYELVDVEGFRLAVAGTQTSRSQMYRGSVLKRIAQDRYDSQEVRQAAKVVLQRALKPHVGDKPLITRELFRRRRG